jgi:hypothetical protein
MIKLNKFKKMNKRGFAFSILSLFLVFLIFGFGSLFLFQSDFTQDSEFRESRILYVNGEIDYFKESYIKSSIQFSAYNTFNELTKYLDSTNRFHIIHKNPEKLNELILEGITKGEFESNPIPNLADKNIVYLTQIFKTNFDENYHGNFTFKILNLSLLETQSYFVDLQMLASYNIETEDNLSNWNFTDEFIIQIPITDLLDPEFLSRGDKQVPIRSSEFHLPTLNWTYDNFNKSLLEMYSTVYYKPSFDYTIGQSYLKRLLGFTKGDYFGVVKALTFDTDEIYDGIYDNAAQSLQGELFGNTLMLIDFNNISSNSSHMFDKSSYSSNILKSINMNCSSFGDIWQESCTFERNIPILNSTYPINFSEKFSISTWINYNTTSTDLIIIGNSAFKFGINEISKKLFFEFENSSSGTSIIFSNNSISESTWTHLAMTYSGSKVSFYVDGLIESSYMVPAPKTQIILNQYFGTETINPINYSIDELGIFSKTLSPQEISKLYTNKFVSRVDYIDSLYGKGIKFDGYDDYLKLNLTSILTSTHSVGIWFKLDDFSSNNFEDMLLISDPYILIKNDTHKLRYFNYGVNDVNGDSYYEGNQELELNKWYYVTTTYDGVTGTYSIYLNGELDAQQSGKFESGSSINIKYIGGENNQSFFNGIIDEIKVYNRVLEIEEIKLNYRNYGSFGKGCCNFITLVNQNALGFNTTSYDDEVPSSSTLFFNFYELGEWNNITLYNTTNFTSLTPSKEYYNLIMDMCLFEVYNFLDYDGYARVPSYDARNEGPARTEWCKNLISDGYY